MWGALGPRGEEPGAGLSPIAVALPPPHGPLSQIPQSRLVRPVAVLDGDRHGYARTTHRADRALRQRCRAQARSGFARRAEVAAMRTDLSYRPRTQLAEILTAVAFGPPYGGSGALRRAPLVIDKWRFQSAPPAITVRPRPRLPVRPLVAERARPQDLACNIRHRASRPRGDPSVAHRRRQVQRKTAFGAARCSRHGPGSASRSLHEQRRGIGYMRRCDFLGTNAYRTNLRAAPPPRGEVFLGGRLGSGMRGSSSSGISPLQPVSMGRADRAVRAGSGETAFTPPLPPLPARCFRRR